MKVGDLVSFLDESGEGEIININGNKILVDVQGFQKSYDISEIIKREQGFENQIINSPITMNYSWGNFFNCRKILS